MTYLELREKMSGSKKMSIPSKERRDSCFLTGVIKVINKWASGASYNREIYKQGEGVCQKIKEFM
jgi:hypothetical protein